MDESAISQNRRSRRSNVLLTAILEVGGAALPVKLRNLSANGALLQGEKLPVAGTPVRFVRNELCVDGRVIWGQGKYAGIAFAERLQPDVVLRHIPPPKPRMKPDFRRPGLACRELSPDEFRLLESWLATAPVPHLGE